MPRVSTSVGVVICSNEEKKMQHHNALCHPLRLSDRHRIKKRKREAGEKQFLDISRRLF